MEQSQSKAERGQEMVRLTHLVINKRHREGELTIGQIRELVRVLQQREVPSDALTIKTRVKLLRLLILAGILGGAGVGGYALGRMTSETPSETVSTTTTVHNPNPAKITVNPIVASEPPNIIIMKSPVDPENMGFGPEDIQRLAHYGVNHQRYSEHPPAILNRTLPHRHEDDEFLLRDILDHRKETSELQALRALLFPKGEKTPSFIDIGPGIANQGAPATTGREIAELFPEMPVVLLDLESEVERFQALIPQPQKDKLLGKRNIHIVKGDGLRPLKEQLEDPDKNLFNKTAPLPKIKKGQTIIIRAANSIDIYCPWSAVKPALARMAEDFMDNPVLLLFNREIIFKAEGSTVWTIVGRTSNRGFDHDTNKLERKGHPPYVLFAEKLSVKK